MLVSLLQREWEEALGRGGCVYGLDSGDGLKGIYVSSDSSSCIHEIGTEFYMSHIPQHNGLKKK